jgi:hypothetical protein
MTLRVTHEYKVYLTLGDHTLSRPILYFLLLLLLVTRLCFAYSSFFRRLYDSDFLRYQEY